MGMPVLTNKNKGQMCYKFINAAHTFRKPAYTFKNVAYTIRCTD